MLPNRPRVIDAYDIARKIRTTFADRDVEYEEKLSCSWPSKLQNVGDSLAVAYGSDKWKPKSANGRRDVEKYKHIAESRNRIFVQKGLFKDSTNPRKSWPVFGDMISLEDVPFPKHFAILGAFLEVDLQLFVAPHEFGAGDDGIVKVTVANATLGASEILWSEVGQGKNEPFLFVYTPTEVVMIITGCELDVEKDGIVG